MLWNRKSKQSKNSNVQPLPVKRVGKVEQVVEVDGEKYLVGSVQLEKPYPNLRKR